MCTIATKRLRRRPLSIKQILTWACIHRETTGHWPTKDSCPIIGAKLETWLGVDRALRDGLRGLPGGGSLAQLLAEAKNVRNIRGLSPLTEEQILKWIDEYFKQYGSWPTAK